MRPAQEAMVLIGSLSPATEAPEVKLSAADAPPRPQAPDEAEVEAPGRGFAIATHAGKALRGAAVYLLAGIVGWCLYGLVEPVHQLWWGLTAGAPAMRENAALAETNRRLDAARAEAEARISQLSARMDELQREVRERRSAPREREPAPSRVDETPTAATTPALAPQKVRSRSHKKRGDAFDPALHPTAPGAPRPLGAHL